MDNCNNYFSSLSVKTIPFIRIKSFNSFHTLEQTQETAFQSLITLFGRLPLGIKPYRTLVPVCGTIYLKPLKNLNILNTFKHNVKILYLKQ